MRTDVEIWAEILAGQDSAWKELVHRYEALVYTVASRANLSYGDVADCFQNTWVLLYQNRKKVQDPGRLSAWLVTTAKREALRLRRKSQRFSPLDDTPELVDNGELPDSELESLQQQHLLEKSLAEIDERCRRLLQALFFEPEKVSYDEIARSIGVSPNTLGPARRRCLDRLKKILMTFGYPDARTED
jgi:RNA polymerase sigma factor (sigma-70 family)